jgi:sugar O-acyltransferase (sialic acid O-acetyltransferase NeuD family)
VAKKDLILVGSGGHCKSCIDVIESEDSFNIAGIVDTQDKLHQKVLDYEVIASDKDLPNLVGKYKDFFIAIGGLKNLSKRIRKFEDLKQLGAQFPMIISPLANVAKNVCIEEGTIVMHRALVNSNVRVGKNCIINTASLIEHDAKVGDHCHISTGSIVNGKCTVGNRVFIGSNSVIIDYVNIGDDVVIGAGSVVVKSISQAGVYVGNPAHRAIKAD